MIVGILIGLAASSLVAAALAFVGLAGTLFSLVAGCFAAAVAIRWWDRRSSRGLDGRPVGELHARLIARADRDQRADIGPALDRIRRHLDRLEAAKFEGAAGTPRTIAIDGRDRRVPLVVLGRDDRPAPTRAPGEGTRRLS